MVFPKWISNPVMANKIEMDIDKKTGHCNSSGLSTLALIIHYKASAT